MSRPGSAAGSYAARAGPRGPGSSRAAGAEPWDVGGSPRSRAGITGPALPGRPVRALAGCTGPARPGAVTQMPVPLRPPCRAGDKGWRQGPRVIPPFVDGSTGPAPRLGRGNNRAIRRPQPGRGPGICVLHGPAALQLQPPLRSAARAEFLGVSVCVCV